MLLCTAERLVLYVDGWMILSSAQPTDDHVLRVRFYFAEVCAVHCVDVVDCR